MPRALIAGCGAVGSHLGRILASQGWEVWGLRRNAAALRPPLQAIAADLAQPTQLRDLPSALDAVVYSCAAGGYDEERYRAAYVQGIENLLTALARQRQSPGRLLFTSSTSVYGEHFGAWVDEDSATGNETFAQRALLEGEALIQRAGGIVVRFGGIYGPGRTALLHRIRHGEARCAEGVYSNRIHQADCARVLAHLLQLRQPAACYVAVDEEPALLCEVMDWLAQELGLAPPPRQALANAERARRGNKRCSSQRLRQTGFEFQFPSYRYGYRELLHGIRNSEEGTP